MLEGFDVVLDANAVTNLMLYVQACGVFNMPIKCDYSEMSNKSNQSNELNWDGIKKGHGVFSLLDYVAKRDGTIYLSLYSKLELFDVLMDRAMDECLTKRSIPYRIRRKRPFRLITLFKYDEKIAGEWDRLIQILDDENIKLAEPESTGNGKNDFLDIIEATKIISRSLCLDAGDLYLLSVSLIESASVLASFDNEFSKVAYNLWDPKGEWKCIKTSIAEGLANSIHRFNSNPEDVLFPMGLAEAKRKMQEEEDDQQAPS
jgi:hypothetical protein